LGILTVEILKPFPSRRYYRWIARSKYNQRLQSRYLMYRKWTVTLWLCPLGWPKQVLLKYS